MATIGNLASSFVKISIRICILWICQNIQKCTSIWYCIIKAWFMHSVVCIHMTACADPLFWISFEFGNEKNLEHVIVPAFPNPSLSLSLSSNLFPKYALSNNHLFPYPAPMHSQASFKIKNHHDHYLSQRAQKCIQFHSIFRSIFSRTWISWDIAKSCMRYQGQVNNKLLFITKDGVQGRWSARVSNFSVPNSKRKHFQLENHIPNTW